MTHPLPQLLNTQTEGQRGKRAWTGTASSLGKGDQEGCHTKTRLETRGGGMHAIRHTGKYVHVGTITHAGFGLERRVLPLSVCYELELCVRACGIRPTVHMLLNTLGLLLVE